MFTAQVFCHLPIADGLHGRAILFESSLEQRAGFFHQSRGKHLFDALIDAALQIFVRPQQAMNRRVVRRDAEALMG
jgi:hypothetical protein